MKSCQDFIFKVPKPLDRNRTFLCAYTNRSRCWLMWLRTIPVLVPRFRLSTTPPIGIWIHISAPSIASSVIPLDSLPNQTASLFWVNVPEYRSIFSLLLGCEEVTAIAYRLFRRYAIHAAVVGKYFTFHTLGRLYEHGSRYLSGSAKNLGLRNRLMTFCRINR